MNNFFKSDFNDGWNEEISKHEKIALDAIRAIARIADKQPDHTLNVGATLRKLSTAAGSKAQSLSLRTVSIRKGRL